MSTGTVVETRSVVVRTAGHRFWVTYRMGMRDRLREVGLSTGSTVPQLALAIAVRQMVVAWEIFESDGSRVPLEFADIDRVPAPVLRAILRRVLTDDGDVLEREALTTGVEQ